MSKCAVYPTLERMYEWMYVHCHFALSGSSLLVTYFLYVPTVPFGIECVKAQPSVYKQHCLCWVEFASVALFLTWRGLRFTLDLVNEGRNECEIRTCGLLGVLEVEAWGRRRHSFKRIRNTLKTCNSGTFQRVRWDGSIYTCHRSQTPPQSSFPVFLYMRLYPSDTYPLFPLS